MEQILQIEEPRPEPGWIGRHDDALRLVASRDRISGRCVFPRVPDRSPAVQRYKPVALSASAILYSFSVIHPNPKTGAKSFVVVYADFPEGARVFGRLELPEGARPTIGMQLEARVEASVKSGATYVFVPAHEVTP